MDLSSKGLSNRLILVLLMALAPGCGGEFKEDQPETGKIAAKDIRGFDTEIQTLIERGQESFKTEPTPFDKIHRALEDKKITKVESILLTYQAAFDPDGLPKAYQGAVPEVIPDGVLIEAEWWLQENWDKLTEEEQEALEPFYLPPDDPKSFYHPDNQERQKDLLDKLGMIPLARAGSGQYKELKTVVSTNPQRVVRISYFDDGTPLMDQKALWASDSAKRAWPMFKELLGKDAVPNHDVRLFLVSMTGPVVGSAVMRNEGGTRWCECKVSKTEDERWTKAITSHELFHCFQYYIPLKYDEPARKWMMEATATWSEHYVWPDYNTEWKRLGSFFSELDLDLINYNKHREYVTYPWYLFLSQKLAPDPIKQNLWEVKSKNGRLVVGSMEYFDSLFAEFALWNWNQDPEIRYRDVPSFPTGVHVQGKMYPSGLSYQSMIHEKNREDHEDIEMESLSTGYRLHAFKDDIKRVLFRFEGEGDPEHRRQALIKIGDIWHWEDWTHIKDRKFCRSRPEERIKAVVLIACNADINKSEKYQLDYDVITKGECNPEWRGYTTWSWSYSTSHEVPALESGVTYHEDSHMTAHDTLVFDEQEGEFLVKEQSISYAYTEKKIIDFSKDCGMLRETIEKTYEGSTSSSWVIDEKYPSQSEAPVRMSADYDDPMLFDVDVDVHEWGKPWIVYTDRREKRRKACPLEGAFTPGPGTYDIVEVDMDLTDRFRTEPNDVEVSMNKDRKEIKGIIKQKVGSGSEAYDRTIEVNYRYE